MGTSKRRDAIEYRTVELDGVKYVILRESILGELCARAGVEFAAGVRDEGRGDGLEVDPMSLAEKLVRRRRVVGMSQAELARQAGIRPETLNRIERGRTVPDFATIRKLVVAMNEAERPKWKNRAGALSKKET